MGIVIQIDFIIFFFIELQAFAPCCKSSGIFWSKFNYNFCLGYQVPLLLFHLTIQPYMSSHSLQIMIDFRSKYIIVSSSLFFLGLCNHQISHGCISLIIILFFFKNESCSIFFCYTNLPLFFWFYLEWFIYLCIFCCFWCVLTKIHYFFLQRCGWFNVQGFFTLLQGITSECTVGGGLAALQI